MTEQNLPQPVLGVPDPELPTVREQLIVFARELGELYQLERQRSAELEAVLSSLQESYMATMKSLALVIEAKDRTTRGHLERTQAYGMALARRMDPALADGAIPLPARIFAVADSFDAMISDRPYRRARPVELALEEIEGGAGTQFDPEVVDAFVSLVGEESLTATEGDDPNRLAHVG